MFFNAGRTIKHLLKGEPKTAHFQWNKTKSILLFYDLEDSIEVANIVQHLHSIGKNVSALSIAYSPVDETENFPGTVIPVLSNHRNSWMLRKKFNLCIGFLGQKQWDLLIDLSKKESPLFPLMAAYVHPKLRCGLSTPMRYFYNLLIRPTTPSINCSNLFSQLMTILEKTE